MTKRALITGLTGQDGAYLSQLLLSKGYEVYGLVRRSSHGEVDTHRLKWLGIADDVRMLDGDLLDMSVLIRVVRETKPDEVYNLGAQSFVKVSWQQPLLTSDVTGVGVNRILEAVRLEAPRTSCLRLRACRSRSRSIRSVGGPMTCHASLAMRRSPDACSIGRPGTLRRPWLKLSSTHLAAGRQWLPHRMLPSRSASR